jgi:NADPH:quinone reductase-like Zn-dependent oxidoreductase
VVAARGEIRPVIDRTYTLDDIVDAHRYVDMGHKRGNVIISVA